jgi:uncharacterized protein
MSEQAAPITRKQMNAPVEGHCRAEEGGELEAIVDGFSPDAEHDVVGRPGDRLHRRQPDQGVLSTPVLRFANRPSRRRYGDDHVVDESALHATAIGRPFGLEGRRRPVRARFLHIFDFSGSLISRESAWIDLAAIQQRPFRLDPGGGPNRSRDAPAASFSTGREGVGEARGLDRHCGQDVDCAASL